MSDEKQLIDLALLHHVERIVEDRIARHEKENVPLVSELRERICELERLIRSGFPHGDPVSHCKVHEQYIVEAADRVQMLKGARNKVFEAGVWAAIVFIGIAIWDYIKTKIGAP